MLTIPPETLTRFVALLEKRTVPSMHRNFYKKWLRYYLDFCAKYRFSDSSSKSLPQFLAKLREKKQADEQIKQAAHAVSVYLDLKRPSNLNRTIHVLQIRTVYVLSTRRVISA